MPSRALVRATDRGLWCPAGGFHIDPWKPVERAVITHGHADHAIRGSEEYLGSFEGRHVLRARLGRSRTLAIRYGESVTIGDTSVSLHPAGHVLGSAQIRIEHKGQVCVVSGDYKTTDDGLVAPFEPVRCHTFITECSFGLPIYRWRDHRAEFADMNSWWARNAAAGKTSVVFCWSLGKAQRVLAGVDQSIGPVAVHGAVHKLNRVYSRSGVRLPSYIRADTEGAVKVRSKGLLIAPPFATGSTGGKTWLGKFSGTGGISTAVVSGWMRVRGRRRWGSHDAGFAISDHADWTGLLDAIAHTECERVGVTHGRTESFARYLNEQGLDAFVIPTRYEGEGDSGENDADEFVQPDPMENA